MMGLIFAKLWSLFCNQEKEEEFHLSLHEAAREAAEVASILHDEAVEKREKLLNLLIREMTADGKINIVDRIVLRLKAKEIYGHITQSQENVKPFSAGVLL